AVAEIGGPVPWPVAGVDQHALAAGLDDRAAAREDRGVARATAARYEQLSPLRAERVEHAPQATARAVDQHDMALIRGCGPEVAAGRRDHVRAGDVERRTELLAGGVAGHGNRPGARAVLAAVRERELVDQPVGRGGVDEAGAGVDQRAGGRDLRRAGPAAIP